MKNIFGGFRCNAINADAARYCRTPLFKEEECPDGAGMIRDIYIENFTCFPVSDLPDDFGGTQGAPKEALRFESRMDNFNIEGFRYIRRQNDLQSCPAVKACHLVKQKISVDGKEFVLENKDDVFTMEDFNSIHIHSYE